MRFLPKASDVRRVAGGGLWLLLIWAQAAAGVDQRPDRPNILLILVDTLRADHVGCYGYGRPTTPAIDSVAAEGVRFRETVAAASWTMPSLATMFTGVPPAAHGVTGPNSLVSDRLTTLAAELRKAGYQTAGVTSNPMANRTFGYARGFEFYDDYTVSLGADLDLFSDAATGRGVNQTMTSDVVNRAALSWLNKRRKPDQPFFLFLLYFDPHADYVPPREYAQRFTDSNYKGSQSGLNMNALRGKPLPAEDIKYLQGLYDAEIRYTDDRIARMLQELKNKNLYNNTLTVIVSDHGEEFWEHGSCTHGATLYEECVMVPWVMRLPGKVSAGSVFDRQVSHLDLMPTILGLAGCAVPTQCGGRDLSRFVATGETGTLPETPAYMETRIETPVTGLRTHTRKLIRHGDDRRELFVLTEDPRERQNLAGGEKARDFAPLIEDLDRREQALRKTAEALGRPVKPQLDARLIQQLRSIGYAR